MRRFTSLGVILALFLVLAPITGAAEGSPTDLPRGLDLLAWVLDWLGISETGSAEMGPGLEPGGHGGPSIPEMGPGVEPNGHGGASIAEMGPSAEPNGHEEPPIAEMGPSIEPNG